MMPPQQQADDCRSGKNQVGTSGPRVSQPHKAFAAMATCTDTHRDRQVSTVRTIIRKHGDKWENTCRAQQLHQVPILMTETGSKLLKSFEYLCCSDSIFRTISGMLEAFTVWLVSCHKCRLLSDNKPWSSRTAVMDRRGSTSP